MTFLVLITCLIALILCIIKVSKATETGDISRDFKILLMYFSEAFLKGAVFDGKALEGDSAIAAARNFVEAIEIVQAEFNEMPDLDDLVLFKKQLDAGIPIARSILKSSRNGDYGTM